MSNPFHLAKAPRASYPAIFAVLICMILVQPVSGGAGRILLDVAFSTLLMLGVWAAGRAAWARRLGAAIALPTLALRWLAFAGSEREVELAAAILSGVFCLFVAIIFASHVMRAREVGSSQIYGAACSYILLGFMWASWYAVADLLEPGALAGRDLAALRPSDLVYFSFVTLTTLGYGDLSPVSPTARTLAILEGIVGQLYIAVFIARLVGVYSTRRHRDRDEAGSPPRAT